MYVKCIIDINTSGSSSSRMCENGFYVEKCLLMYVLDICIYARIYIFDIFTTSLDIIVLKIARVVAHLLNN